MFVQGLGFRVWDRGCTQSNQANLKRELRAFISVVYKADWFLQLGITA